MVACGKMSTDRQDQSQHTQPQLQRMTRRKIIIATRRFASQSKIYLMIKHFHQHKQPQSDTRTKASTKTQARRDCRHDLACKKHTQKASTNTCAGARARTPTRAYRQVRNAKAWTSNEHKCRFKVRRATPPTLRKLIRSPHIETQTEKFSHDAERLKAHMQRGS